MDRLQSTYVSRAGLKLEHALREFGVDMTGMICVDFGCNVGGFTDCLLQHGAAKVFAIDTGYGVLDWKLRNDRRVVVMERTNVLHGGAPQSAERIDLVTIDLGWTAQRFSIPAALHWLASSPRDTCGRSVKSIITLIKPHYELSEDERRELLRDGVLASVDAERVCSRVLDEMPSMGVEVMGITRSPITGGKSAKKARKSRQSSSRASQGEPGNIEFLALLRPR